MDDFDLVPIDDDFDLVPITNGAETGALPRSQSRQRRKSDSGFMSAVGETISNIPSSAKQFGSDLVQPIMHPVDTAKSLWDLGKGVIQLAIPGEQGSEDSARAVGQFIADRYGGVDKALHTLKTDPVGIVADASMLLTGGGTAVARAPGVLGKVGKAASNVGNAIDPLNVAGKGVSLGAKFAGKTASTGLGIATGTGSLPIEQAYSAGKRGSKPFTENMRGHEPFEGVVKDAHNEMAELSRDRLRQYKTDAKVWKGVKGDLPFDDVIGTWSDELDSLKVGDQTVIGKTEMNKVEEISEVLNQWYSDPNAHTAAGFDGLKQRLDNIDINAEKFGQADRIRTSIRNSVKDTIVQRVPEYADAMKKYEDAITAEKEVSKTFSMGRNAAVDTTLRKMQSTMRNNVNTNYGKRTDMMQGLDRKGQIMDKLAGQSLNEFSPRGLQKMLAGGAAYAGFGNPVYWGSLPLQSPRLVGEAAHALGKGGKLTKELLKSMGISPEIAKTLGMASFQGGRLSEELKRRK